MGISLARFAGSMAMLALGASVHADIVTIPAIADAFVDSAQPANNYGGGGSLGVAAPGSPRGEFQALLRFPASSALGVFDDAFGPNRWRLASATLRLNAALPVNMLFNPSSPGEFAVTWMSDDSWDEGSGTPASPGTTGITFTSLPSFLSGPQEPLGVLTYAGETIGDTDYPLMTTTGFASDIASGNLVSLRVSAVGTSVAYLFHSRSFGSGYEPRLVLTAVASCAVDFDHSGGVSVQDIFAFLNAWFAGTSGADFNADGTTAVQDIFDFLNAWFVGC